MAPLQNTSTINFVVETMRINRDGKKLGMIRPSADGYYTIPMMVLGCVTLNKTYYDIPYVVEQITSPESFMYKLLTDGKLHAEYGHPDVSLLEQAQQINRLLHIEPKNVCCHIRKLWAGDTLSDGSRLILGEVKPVGPYGENLRDSLDDPNINTSFSLRSIASNEMRNGIQWRKIKKLVTFDAVLGGGYEQAAKRYSPGVESLLSIPMVPSVAQLTEVAMESFTRHELNDIFGAKEITIENRVYTKVPTGTGALLVTPEGQPRSVYHELIGQR